MTEWDVVVIGGGAAGLSAAAEVAGAGLTCLVLDRMGGGGELMNLGPLEDVDGAPAGPDLAAQLLEAALTAGAELGVAEVTGLTREPAGWHVLTDDETHHARAVILAIGLAPGVLGLDGEAAFEGRGLSHCAACDGPLYRGEPVVVAGADRWAIAEARELAAIASGVTLVTQGDGVPEADARFAVLDGCVIGLEGASGLEAVLVRPNGGGPVQRLPTQVVFVQTARRPALAFASDFLAHAPDGRIETDAALCCGPPGLFAAGDACAGSARTLAAAIADGHRAAAAVLALLSPLGNRAGSE